MSYARTPVKPCATGHQARKEYVLHIVNLLMSHNLIIPICDIVY
jgi:hypothetical protein